MDLSRFVIATFFLLFAAFTLSAATNKTAGAVDSVGGAARRAKPFTAGFAQKMRRVAHLLAAFRRFRRAHENRLATTRTGIKTGRIQWRSPRKLTVADLTTTFSRRSMLMVPLTMWRTSVDAATRKESQSGGPCVVAGVRTVVCRATRTSRPRLKGREIEAVSGDLSCFDTGRKKTAPNQRAVARPTHGGKRV